MPRTERRGLTELGLGQELFTDKFGGQMTQVCPFCRDVVHVSSGFFTRHGVRHHGIFELCAGSGTPIFSLESGCCGS